ncbi:MAG TPA: SRPBCC domain-containing protein [Puia sp.]|nr:SRPBCC domain-containing protein [Puia sp.]
MVNVKGKNMMNQPIVVERVYDVPVSKLWDAISNNEQLKKWYFQISEFKPIVGFEFSFSGGAKGEYKHLCRVSEVITEKKLTYSWRYEGYPGNSFVSFELFEEGKKTKLILTHVGLESFKDAGADFAPEKFAEGWNYILGTSLKKYLEPEKATVSP